MSRPGRALKFRNRVAALADRLPPPRDEAARAVLRSARALATGRPSAPPAPAAPPAKAAAPTPAKPAPIPGVPIFAQPGSFASPIVKVTEIIGTGSDIDELVELPGIELDLAAHAEVWATWVPHMDRWASGEASGHRRYHTDNRMFGALSARLLAGAIGAAAPRRYIEIGSGFSSAVLLDINDEWRADDPIELTFIEPYPKRLESILREGDRDNCTILTEKVQHVDLAVFDQLEPGDVLFVDSSHVAKTSSDLLFEIFDILPRLPVGVHIHFHDIPYPFDYPMNWLVEQNRSWNETYFLRSFLMYNAKFGVHFWTDYFARFGESHAAAEGFAPLRGQRPTSIWLQRTVA